MTYGRLQKSFRLYEVDFVDMPQQAPQAQRHPLLGDIVRLWSPRRGSFLMGRDFVRDRFVLQEDNGLDSRHGWPYDLSLSSSN